EFVTLSTPMRRRAAANAAAVLADTREHGDDDTAPRRIATSVRILSLALSDEDDGVRATALSALARGGRTVREMLPWIAPRLRDPESRVRRRAAEALEATWGRPVCSILLGLVVCSQDALVGA